MSTIDISDSDDGITVKTILTQQEEDALLNDKQSEVKSSTDVHQPIPQIQPKPKVLQPPRFGNTGGEVIMMLPPTTHSTANFSSAIPDPTPKSGKKKNRTRSKTRRSNANAQRDVLLQQQSLNGHGKRNRFVGDTPPGVYTPSKKAATASHVDSKHKTNALVPPVFSQQLSGSVTVPPAANQQSSGSNHDSVASAAQSTALVPPANANMQSSGSSSMQIDNDHATQPTFADIASSLCVAIVDQRIEGSINLMDQQRFDQLSSLITDKIIAQAGKNIKPPVIDDTRLFGGVMRIRCADVSTRQWLDKFVPTFDKTKLWKGAKLTVMDFNNIPKPYKFNVWFKGLKKTYQEIFKLLELLNKGIVTKSWSILRFVKKMDGTEMTIGVGQESFEAIQKRNNTLYCGLGKAEFKLVQHCKENKTAIQQGDKRNQQQQKVVAKKAAVGAPTTSNPNATGENNTIQQTVEQMDTLPAPANPAAVVQTDQPAAHSSTLT